MKRLNFIFLFLLCGGGALFAQLTLEECQAKAEANYPMIRQYNLVKEAEAYSLSNANKGYLPQVSFSGKATYQSDVTNIPFPDGLIPDFSMPKLSKDQYGATVEVSQSIWDGGVIKTQKEITRKSADADLAQTEVTVYALRERVNQLFFGVLLLNEQLNLNRLMANDLSIQFDKVTSLKEKGVANQSDLDVVQVNLLTVKQQSAELINTRAAYVRMLSAMIGEPVEPSAPLAEPMPEEIEPSPVIHRPELMLYNRQSQLLEQQKQLLQAKNLPKFGLFVQGSGGKPGLNMLNNDFQFYYIGGIRVSWNIGQMYTRRGERRLLENQQNRVAVQRDLFLYNTRQQELKVRGEIDKYRQLMEDDDRLVELRRNIRLASEYKVAEGTMSVNDMMRDYNAEQQAMQNRVVHKVQMLTNLYGLKYLTNH